MKILIIKMSSLGDVIHTLPSLELLKMGFPDAEIDWLVEKQNSDILDGHPYIHHVIVLDRKGWGTAPWKLGRTFRELRDFIKGLRDNVYDLVLDFQGLLRSGIIAGLSRGRRKLGFMRVREMAHIFYNERVPCSTLNQHAVTRYLEIPEYLGLKTDCPRFFFQIPEAAIEEADSLFKELGIDPGDKRGMVFINPNSRWVSKIWPWPYFRDLIRELSKDRSGIILIGGAGEREGMLRAFSGLGKNVHIVAGRTKLMVLAAMLKKGGCLVTNDSGPMHLAVAVGLPVVALFGPTNPVRTGPFGWEDKVNFHRVLKEDGQCRFPKLGIVGGEGGIPGDGVIHSVAGLPKHGAIYGRAWPTKHRSTCGETGQQKHIIINAEAQPPKHRVIVHDLPCMPCYKKFCKSRECLKGISVSRVLEAVEAVLGSYEM